MKGRHPMISLQAPHEKRPIRYQGIWSHDGWKLKVYSASQDQPLAREELVDAIKKRAVETLPQPAVIDRRYGVGFLCAHDARGGCFAFVDWWADDNELHHHLFSGPKDDPHRIAPVGPDDLTACVWDLAIMAFERDAWLETVLANPDGPDLAAYLDRHLEGEL